MNLHEFRKPTTLTAAAFCVCVCVRDDEADGMR